MTLTIYDDSISSDHTRHTARLAPGHEHAWHVSWLPGRLMDRNTTITAPDALAWASQPPGPLSIGKDAAILEDPEASS